MFALRTACLCIYCPLVCSSQNKTLCLLGFGHREYATTFSVETWCRMHWLARQTNFWKSKSDFCVGLAQLGLLELSLIDVWRTWGIFDWTLCFNVQKMKLMVSRALIFCHVCAELNARWDHVWLAASVSIMTRFHSWELDLWHLQLFSLPFSIWCLPVMLLNFLAMDHVFFELEASMLA